MRLVYETAVGVYLKDNDDKKISDFREELIGQIRSAMQRVFDDLVLNSISDPLNKGTFTFKKGGISSYDYINLSGGEKAAFDLLLDIYLKRRFFKDAIYCIDEVETHLHTQMQGRLVRELVAAVPDESQLWITTHSLGVLRAAQLLDKEKPGTVSVLDFHGVDHDTPQTVKPSSLDRVTWEKMLSIALDDLSARVTPEVVVVCEGSATGKARRDFDAEIYNRVLAGRTTGVVFVSGGSSSQVEVSGTLVRVALQQVASGAKVVPLVDRDEKTEAEVAAIERGGGLVLPLRSLEAYLFADDVIEALAKQHGKAELLPEALRLRDEALRASVARKNPSDDYKSAAGEIHNALRQLFDVKRSGSTKDVFMRDVLAPLIDVSMPTYAKLKAAILDRLPRATPE